MKPAPRRPANAGSRRNSFSAPGFRGRRTGLAARSSRRRTGAPRYVPAAVLTAIWAPEVLVQNERLLAGVVAIAVAWRWRTTFATIIAGLLALHLFGFLR
ncbi:MAG TPA: AzlD domain-containing protein [Burkholderiales bacterium]|nr:AzlD domain-containing protein [Burkholderiales bacterium]